MQGAMSASRRRSVLLGAARAPRLTDTGRGPSKSAGRMRKPYKFFFCCFFLKKEKQHLGRYSNSDTLVKNGDYI